jgi:hypothetical protein
MPAKVPNGRDSDQARLAFIQGEMKGNVALTQPEEIAGRHEHQDRDSSFLAALHLCSLYHHLVDAGRWTEFASVFSADAEFTSLTGAVNRGAPAIAENLKRLSSRTDGLRAVAHHSSNVIVVQSDDRSAQVESKYFAVMSDGTVVSGLYIDRIVNTDVGWRIASRHPQRLVGPSKKNP